MTARLRTWLRLTGGCALLAVFGCSGRDDASGVATRRAALAHPGPWEIPAETLAIGDTQFVPYTGAGAWLGESHCLGAATPDALALRAELLERFPQIGFIGDYACRPINGDDTRMSVHAVGRALDVHIPTTEAGEADNDLGDPVGDWLIENAQALGVQYLIWDRWQWRANLPPGIKDSRYGGAHPHNGHLHVEMAQRDVGSEQPERESAASCPALPPAGGIVDELAPCFHRFGPERFWREEHGAGYEGALYWTNAFQSETPSNWALWEVQLSEAGEYRVEAYVDPAFGRFESVRYEVAHDGQMSLAHVNQFAADGWVLVGTFWFAEGGGQYVSVFDDAPGSVASDSHIAVDAIRLSRIERPVFAALVALARAAQAGATDPQPAASPAMESDPPPHGSSPAELGPCRLERSGSGCASAGAPPGSSPGGWLLLVVWGLRRARRLRWGRCYGPGSASDP